MAHPSSRSSWLHRFTILTSALTFGLIFLGGLVKSHEAGLAVPDWPNSFGWNMFTFPVRYWVGGIFYEHTHRLLATLVGTCTIVQAVWLQRKEERSWVRKLGWFAVGGVIVQGIFGGLTVHMLLETWVATVHSALAQTMFCVTVAIALVTGKKWRRTALQRSAAANSVHSMTRLSVAVIFLQLLIGAVMRHENAGLAIPTFPLAPNGSLIPEFGSFGVVIHFIHRAWAVVVSAIVITTCWKILKTRVAGSSASDLRRPAIIGLVVLVIQVTLGAITVLSFRAITPTTLHVSTGAALLAVMFTLMIRARHQLSPVEAGQSEADQTVAVPAAALSNS